MNTRQFNIPAVDTDYDMVCFKQLLFLGRELFVEILQIVFTITIILYTVHKSLNCSLFLFPNLKLTISLVISSACSTLQTDVINDVIN